MTLVPASDGQLARRIDEWSREKHHYIERYIDIFRRSMKGKWELVYADLFSGPGICVDSASGLETPGSPLLALRYREFSRLFINDADRRVTEALSARTVAEPSSRVRISTAKADDAIDQARRFLYPIGASGGILGLGVIDPFGLNIAFDSIRKLTSGVRMDLIIVFMSEYIRRFGKTPEFERQLDSLYGVPDWRPIVAEHDGRKVTYRKILDLYEAQLGSIGYVHTDDSIAIRNSVGRVIYHIIFASRHPLGKDFFEKISTKDDEGQKRMF